MNRVTAVDRGGGNVQRFQTHDDYAVDASERVMTPEGFMIVPAKIARTGIQEYSAAELKIEGTDRVIRLCRLPEEVFKPAAIKSFEGQTLTSGHPEGNVNATNWKQVTSGDVYGVKQFGDNVHVAATLKFKDAYAIDSAIGGRDKLSCGYDFTLDMTPGHFEGQAYDGLMRDIVGNHVAHVYQARGGPGLRIADHDPNRGTDMFTAVEREFIDQLNKAAPADTESGFIDQLNKAAAARDAAFDEGQRSLSQGDVRKAHDASSSSVQEYVSLESLICADGAKTREHVSLESLVCGGAAQ